MENANANLKKDDTKLFKMFSTLPVNKDKNAAAVFSTTIEHLSELEKRLKFL